MGKYGFKDAQIIPTPTEVFVGAVVVKERNR